MMDFSKYVIPRGLLIKLIFLVIATVFILGFTVEWEIPTSAMRIMGIQRLHNRTTPKLKATYLPKCPNVLKHMVHGTWDTHGMTEDQEKEAWKFLEVSRRQFGAPTFMQRNDSRCGNALYNRWIRALCDPFSKKPCCFNNTCTARSIDQCRCENCRDMRQEVHAMYSKWIPFDRRCPVKIFDKNEACKLLDGATLFLCGDSLIRHIYTALIIILTNNTIDGALKKNIPKENTLTEKPRFHLVKFLENKSVDSWFINVHEQCLGPYMFTEKVCRGHVLYEKDLKNVCGGKTKILFSYFYSTASGYAFSNRLKTLKNTTRSMAIFGVGLHDSLDSKKVLNKYILPAVKNKGHSYWPKMLWTTPHCPGIIKNVNTPHPQSKYGIWKFITHLASALPPLNISYFNTFNMTDGVSSYDGTHYGMGVNMLKVQIILNRIQELKNNGDWP